MLEFSSAVVSSFSREARTSAERDLCRHLAGRMPALASDTALPARVADLVSWAESEGVTSRFDVQTMAELTFLRGLDLAKDEDFHAALRAASPPHDCVMLRYLERKAPSFWTDPR